jgi:hypothetical protein
MKDWETLFNNLSETEKDKLAILRVMECSNGCIQYAFRDSESHALSLEETRRAMKFSMSCMKTMSIPFKDRTITFEPETEELFREVRELYISGVKFNNDDDYKEFIRASGATARACGEERIVKAKNILEENIDDIPPHTLEWGVRYLLKFLK